MLTREQAHVFGMKVLGLICLTWAIQGLFDAVPNALNVSGPLISIEGSLLSTEWLYLFIPAVLGALGFCLLKTQVTVIREFFGAQEKTQGLDSRSLFTIGLRVYGVYLVTSHVSTFVAILANLAVVVFAASYMSTERELEYVRSYVFPCLTAISLGVFCFLKGRFIARLAFRD
jgi:hypothetical protein